MPKPRLLLIGWDAADWKMIRPLLDAGEMPKLQRLMTAGVHGNLATIHPVLSPMLWTSIATGKRAWKHGIHGFSEPLPDGSGVRPISILSRKTKAVWNILNQKRWRSIVAGWWPSHPAEPLNGAMVSNHFARLGGTPEKPSPLPAGGVHPPRLAKALAELRVHPMELDGEFIRLFAPNYEHVDQAKDKRLHTLGKIIAETMSLHAAATELLAKEAWDFAAIYYDAIDHFGHAFMRYHPPRQPWISEADFAVYQHVMANAYRYHDAMLGTLLRFADDRTTVILMSDHGFHPDHLRPAHIPAEPAGPAVEHRPYGILVMRGPALRANERLYGASVLDVCPTILTLCGLPPGRDMDGKVLVNAYREPPKFEPIESWDTVPGAAGLHPSEARVDAVSSAQAFQQLVDLGYVAPPADNVKETVEQTVAELRYNLARAYADGGRFHDAARLAEDLWQRWPKEHRFGVLWIEALGALRETKRRRDAIAELERRIELYREEAAKELARLQEQEAQKPKDERAKGFGGPTREEFQRRKLIELARPRLLAWLKTTQALLERRRTEARVHLEQLLAGPPLNAELGLRVAGALIQLGDLEPAERVLGTVIELDPDCAAAFARLAQVHFRARRDERAIETAVESLSLLYFQPAIHFLLGRALMRSGRYAEAEQSLRTAVTQNPGFAAAHALLGRLYRRNLNRPQDAFAAEGRARTIQAARALRREEPKAGKEESVVSGPWSVVSTREASADDACVPSKPAGEHGTRNTEHAPPAQQLASAAGPRDPHTVITVVSGLPRSGTSLMMQLLAAGGIEPLTDGKRAADEDNPLGYFEFEQASALAKDASWLPLARGKAVKLVAQLLPHLPRGEQYRVIFMQRDLDEVLASQRRMLQRLGRGGAALDDQQLAQTYAAQTERLRALLAKRDDVALLEVDYAALLADPLAGAGRVRRFLGRELNVEAAASAVRPELRRQRTSGKPLENAPAAHRSTA